MSAPDKVRVDGQAAYVLHAYPYSETSLIAEVFTREHGRLALMARGARRPRSPVRGVLMAFQPLELSWFGRGEIRTLARAEWVGGQPLLAGRSLLLGYYVNELLLKLLPREDPHPALFDAYRDALATLAAGDSGQTSLRRFEKSLLKELGYDIPLETEADTRQRIDPDKRYIYLIERGPLETPGNLEDASTFTGRALLAIAANDYTEPETRLQARRLMRILINHYLGGQSLDSRRVFMELQEL